MTSLPEQPPLPHTVFRIGVTGHRPNRLSAADIASLQAQIDRVLHTIRDSVLQPGTALRVISSLAEGADRLVARAALAQHFTLQVPLPFPQPDYETDFDSPASVADFRALLAQSSSTFVLAAPHSHRSFGYRAAGNIILHQCDLLFAVWDGGPALGVGGTPETIERAIELHLPVLYIEAAAPHRIHFLHHGHSDSSADPLADLAAFVRSATQPLDRETVWPGAHELPAHLTGSPRTAEIETPQLRPYFRWADALAVHYGALSRSAALRLQVLATVAVLAALFILPFEDRPHVIQTLSLIELAATVWLILSALRVGRTQWHVRWLLYRSLAEQVRSLDLLAPIARTLRLQRNIHLLPASVANLSAASQLVQAIARETGLLPATADHPFLAGRLHRLAQVVHHQGSFQQATARRYQAVETALHRIGITIFSLACGLCVLDVLRAFRLGATQLFGHPITAASIATPAAVLPALGAACAGIAAQGEFRRLALRAESMAETLIQIAKGLDSRHHPSLDSLAEATHYVSDVLTSEVHDWQVLVASKPPSLPT
jgi:hypothetical protein